MLLVQHKNRINSLFFLVCVCVFIFSSQVKKSTLNPNAKEFNPIKPQIPLVRH